MVWEGKIVASRKELEYVIVDEVSCTSSKPPPVQSVVHGDFYAVIFRFSSMKP